MDKINAPDVVGMSRPQPDDGAVLVIEPFAPLVALRQLKAFFTPKALHFLVVHMPAFDLQQMRDLAVAIAPILLGQPDQSQT